MTTTERIHRNDTDIQVDAWLRSPGYDDDYGYLIDIFNRFTFFTGEPSQCRSITCKCSHTNIVQSRE